MQARSLYALVCPQVIHSSRTEQSDRLGRHERFRLCMGISPGAYDEVRYGPALADRPEEVWLHSLLTPQSTIISLCLPPVVRPRPLCHSLRHLTPPAPLRRVARRLLRLVRDAQTHPRLEEARTAESRSAQQQHHPHSRPHYHHHRTHVSHRRRLHRPHLVDSQLRRLVPQTRSCFEHRPGLYHLKIVLDAGVALRLHRLCAHAARRTARPQVAASWVLVPARVDTAVRG